jgi:hypothetical protein
MSSVVSIDVGQVQQRFRMLVLSYLGVTDGIITGSFPRWYYQSPHVEDTAPAVDIYFMDTSNENGFLLALEKDFKVQTHNIVAEHTVQVKHFVISPKFDVGFPSIVCHVNTVTGPLPIAHSSVGTLCLHKSFLNQEEFTYQVFDMFAPSRDASRVVVELGTILEEVTSRHTRLTIISPGTFYKTIPSTYPSRPFEEYHRYLLQFIHYVQRMHNDGWTMTIPDNLIVRDTHLELKCGHRLSVEYNSFRHMDPYHVTYKCPECTGGPFVSLFPFRSSV